MVLLRSQELDNDCLSFALLRVTDFFSSQDWFRPCLGCPSQDTFDQDALNHFVSVLKLQFVSWLRQISGPKEQKPWTMKNSISSFFVLCDIWIRPQIATFSNSKKIFLTLLHLSHFYIFAVSLFCAFFVVLKAVLLSNREGTLSAIILGYIGKLKCVFIFETLTSSFDSISSARVSSLISLMKSALDSPTFEVETSLHFPHLASRVSDTCPCPHLKINPPLQSFNICCAFFLCSW